MKSYRGLAPSMHCSLAPLMSCGLESGSSHAMGHGSSDTIKHMYMVFFLAQLEACRCHGLVFGACTSSNFQVMSSSHTPAAKVTDEMKEGHKADEKKKATED